MYAIIVLRITITLCHSSGTNTMIHYISLTPDSTFIWNMIGLNVHKIVEMENYFDTVHIISVWK